MSAATRTSSGLRSFAAALSRWSAGKNSSLGENGYSHPRSASRASDVPRLRLPTSERLRGAFIKANNLNQVESLTR